jgi:hypothetical protein
LDRIDIENIVRTLTDYTRNASTPILIENVQQQPEDCGSGTLLEIEGRYLVATAAHLVKKAPLASVVIPYAEEPSRFTPNLRGCGWRGGELTNALDIAWIEIEPQAAKSMKRQFRPLECIGLESPREDEWAFIHAFPAELFVNQGSAEPPRYLSKAAPYLTTFRGIDDAGEMTSPPVQDTDVFLNWRGVDNDQVPEGWLQEPPGAPGMSGGGIWELGVQRGAVAIPRLVAIQHAWRKGDWLRGTHMRHWLQMVAEDIPEVASTIHNRLQKRMG